MNARWRNLASAVFLSALVACQGEAPQIIQAEEPLGAGSWEKTVACARSVAAKTEDSRCLECHPLITKEESLSPEIRMVHAGHLNSPLLRFHCTHCHTGVDFANGSAAGLRRQVSVEGVCLGCHGLFSPVHGASWEETQKQQPGLGCLTCHGERQAQEKHNAPYLVRGAIEGKEQVCYGCHGGMAWYPVVATYGEKKGSL